MNLEFMKHQIISNARVFDIAGYMTGAAEIKYHTRQSFGSGPVDNRWQHRLSRHLLLHSHFVFLRTTAKNS